MKTPDDQLLAHWLDGELSSVERARFEAMMAADPALQAEAQSMKKLGDLLRSSVPMEREVPHADFFNSQIQERISAEQQTAFRVKENTQGASWLNWLRQPWALAGATALLTVGFFIFGQHKPQTEVLSFYTPKSNVHAKSFHSDAANATVLMLAGLEAIPADKNIVGINVSRSESDTAYATTTLFDEQGGVVLVMSKDARNQPVFLGSKS
jgi:hypothetical protein